MRDVQTGHVPYHSRGYHERWKWRNAIRASCHRLRHDEHLDGTETAKMGWSSGRTSILHDSSPQWPSHGSRKRQSKNGIHGAVYGAIITGSRIGGAICAHAGLPWFQSRNPDVDCQCGPHFALRTAEGVEVVAVDRVDHQECTGNVPGSGVRGEVCSEGGGGIPDIRILGATPLTIYCPVRRSSGHSSSGWEIVQGC